MILIGYSGHSYVVYTILNATGKTVTSYCDATVKEKNPFALEYLGTENDENALSLLKENPFFISIGDNKIRRKIQETLALKNLYPINAIHPSVIIDSSVTTAVTGVMIAAGVIINALAKIHEGAICNTGCIIEHECVVEKFVHIGPGAILCGNVSVGENSFVGAGSVIRQGIKIGKNVIIGAGSVVVKDVADNMKIMGCPAK